MTKSTILLTGATGALGSEVLPRLLAKGHRVFCLARGKDGRSPQERIDRITGGSTAAVAIEGDVCLPRCGIRDMDRSIMQGLVSRLVHGAASISFEKEEITYLTNVEGVKNALEVAEVLGVHDFNHISTAYIAGNARSFSENDLQRGQSLPNAYAHTKLTGETMVRTWALANPQRSFTVFRPSILVGREDGTTSDFNTYYGYMYPYYMNAEAVRRRVAAGKQLPNDISVNHDGVVHTPLVVRMSNESTLNLVTVDWVADMLSELLDIPSANKTYHLAHPKPTRVREVLDISLARLRVEGVRVVNTDIDELSARKRQSRLLAVLQERMDKIHLQYLPYVTAEPEFSMQNAHEALNGRYRDPPTIDKKLIHTLLDFAVERQWKSNGR